MGLLKVLFSIHVVFFGAHYKTVAQLIQEQTVSKRVAMLLCYGHQEKFSSMYNERTTLEGKLYA